MANKKPKKKPVEAPAPKKRFPWWIIVAAVVVVVAIVLGILFLGDKPEEQAYAPNTPEGVSMTFIEAYYTRNYIVRFALTYHNSRQHWEDQAIQREGSAEQFFDLVQQQADARGIEASIHSFDDYYACYYRFCQEDIQAQYGDHTITTRVVDSQKMEPEVLEQRKADAIAAYDAKYINAEGLNTVTEGYTVSVNIKIEGTIKTFSETYLVYVVNYDGRWVVISHSI